MSADIDPTRSMSAATPNSQLLKPTITVALLRTGAFHYASYPLSVNIPTTISTAASSGKKLVLGCGSNVVDHIYYVKGMSSPVPIHCLV